MIGFFIVIKTPAVGATMLTAYAEHDNAIEGIFYIPFLNRNGQSNIKKGSRFFGILDEVSGYGAILHGIGDADFAGKMSGSLQVEQDITVGAVSLKNHIHDAGEALVSPAGNCTGVTGSPVGG